MFAQPPQTPTSNNAYEEGNICRLLVPAKVYIRDGQYAGRPIDLNPGEEVKIYSAVVMHHTGSSGHVPALSASTAAYRISVFRQVPEDAIYGNLITSHPIRHKSLTLTPGGTTPPTYLLHRNDRVYVGREHSFKTPQGEVIVPRNSLIVLGGEAESRGGRHSETIQLEHATYKFWRTRPTQMTRQASSYRDGLLLTHTQLQFVRRA
ncbi:hypothetical protein Hypma_014864 [Hypsizygus marmoreus]|uniref:Uncharacterized protein n=1 Tax=Hypsizygus marmoreus TaxID=39966 RepID=A0A369K4Y9_HYPMA|nr:hypothetical protein Hypma_014864 [Hypsizygus marmoreus]